MRKPERARRKVVYYLRNKGPPDVKRVSIKTGLTIPEYVKNLLRTFTPRERALTNSERGEVVSSYEVKFNKNPFKILSIKSSGNTNIPSPEYMAQLKKVIRYVVWKNLNTMIKSQRNFVFNNWNGSIIITIKKLVKVGGPSRYMIPWHRDAYDTVLFGKRAKGFAVGALYVNKPERFTGGEIQFAKNKKRFSLAPPSGTSVTFYDDDVFHRVTPLAFEDMSPSQNRVEFVPRSGFFFAYMTRKISKFKAGMQGFERNYESVYRNIKSNPSFNMFLRSNAPASRLNQTSLNALKSFLTNKFKNEQLNVNKRLANLRVIYKNLNNAFRNNQPTVNTSSFITFPEANKKIVKRKLVKPSQIRLKRQEKLKNIQNRRRKARLRHSTGISIPTRTKAISPVHPEFVYMTKAENNWRSLNKNNLQKVYKNFENEHGYFPMNNNNQTEIKNFFIQRQLSKYRIKGKAPISIG